MSKTHFTESIAQFEKRKKDHIALALNAENEASGFSGLNKIKLIHHALPELDFSDINIGQSVLNIHTHAPFLISSMTAGHSDSERINRIFAEASSVKQWLMGVGSQRRQLFDENSNQEWRSIKKAFPHSLLLGNIGISQLIHTSLDHIKRLLEPIEAKALIIHTNPLQEALQPEGTPNFKGSMHALERLCTQLKDIPVILKETGCGFSSELIAKLDSIGLYAIDTSGFGGTHWGRIEGKRAHKDWTRQRASETFKDWGISTLETMKNARNNCKKTNIWASGGVRSGLDAAKLLAMGAQVVGFAKPILEAALKGVDNLIESMACIEYELKLAMFCTNTANLTMLKESNVWYQSEP